ncbi:MAG: hypothetical protein CALGDGBN_01934 [Pseudomonadales bacterium]|nr:hypothetical protein [Pseudomonadales bacterium]
MAVAARIPQRAAAELVGRQVHHESGFASIQRGLVVGRDLGRAARHVPHAHLVQRADEGTIAFPRAAEVQRVGVRTRWRGAQGAGRCRHTVQIERHHTRVAVHHGRDVVPLAQLDRTARGTDPLVLVVARGQVQVARGVQPQRERALVAVAVALVRERLPGGRVRVDAEPGLEGQRARHRQRVVVGDLRPAILIEPQRTVDHAGSEMILHAVALADGDVDHLVDHRAHGEGIARFTGGVVPPFDQQRVGSVAAQRHWPDVVAAAGGVHVRRPEHRASVRIEQPPVHITAAAAGDVEVEALAGGGIEAVDLRLRGRTQRGGDRGSGFDRRRLPQIQQPEAVCAGDLVRVAGVGGRVERQRVGARAEVVDRRAIHRIAVPERPVRRHRPLRTAQRPAQVVAVDVRRCRETVEIHPRRFIQREGVDVALARHRDRLALRLAEHQRHRRLVDDGVHTHAVTACRRQVVA